MPDVLLLNATFEPICVVAMRRAVVLVLAEKADVVADLGDAVVRSAHLRLPAPAVIRLRYYVKVPYRGRPALSNRAVLRRDGHECAYCGKRRATTIDHVVPRSRGGPHEWDNVVAACAPCNARKGDRLLVELGWRLRFAPTVPPVTRRIVLGVARVDPAWEPWLSPAGEVSVRPAPSSRLPKDDVEPVLVST